MSNETLEDIARRLLHHPNWKWREGMLTQGPGTSKYNTIRVVPQGRTGRIPEWTGLWPDLTDWATVGVLLGMLKDTADGRLSFTVQQAGVPYSYIVLGRQDLGEQDSPGAAVALALLEAWA